MTTTTWTDDLRLKASRMASPHSLSSYLRGGIAFLLLFFVAAVEMLPIVWMFSTSLRLPTESFDLPPDFFPTSWRWENYLAVLKSPEIDYLLFFINSLNIALAITGAQLVTCSMAAFAFARLRFRGRDFLFFLFLASMMVPSQATVVPLFVIIRNLGLIDSHGALILPAVTSAFGVFLLRQFFMTLPGELMDAAKIDGAGFFRIYAHIMLPLVGPGLSALGVFTFLGSWNNFFGPLLFLRSFEKFTVPLALVVVRVHMGQGSQAHILAAIMMSVLPVLVVFLSAQRFVVRGIALTGLKV